MAGKSIWRASINPVNGILYIREIVDQFSLKFTLLCISVYIGGRGAILQWCRSIELPLYQYGGWDSSEYQTYMAVSSAPMTLKAICGILSDIFPFAGYEKSSWMMIWTTCGVAGCLTLIFTPMVKESVFVGLPALLLFLMQTEGAFNDLLTEGKYVEIMNKQPSSRGNIVSFMYFCITLGEMIPHFTVGSLVDVLPMQHMFLIILPFCIQPYFFILSGCMITDKASSHRNNRIDFIKLSRQKRIMILAFYMFLVCLGTVVVSMLTGPIGQFIYVCIGGSSCILVTYFTLPKIIANINLYIFITQFAFVNLTGATDYYYTADDSCIPNGPNFTMLFMRTYAGIVSSIARLAAVWFFQAILTHYTYRISFWTTTVFRCIASIINIIIITRFNLRIGLPDELVYLIGNSFGIEMSYMMDHMPAALMMAKLCPKTVEGTVFAILAGFGNFGVSIGRYIGGFMMDIGGVYIGQDKPCNTDNLILLIIIGHLIIPLICIVFVFLLVPNYKIKDDISFNLYNNSKYYYSEEKKMSLP